MVALQIAVALPGRAGRQKFLGAGLTPPSHREQPGEETGVTCEAFYPNVIPKDELCTAVLSRTGKSLAALGPRAGKHH